MANPQRMCIVCRGRFEQEHLYRFVVKEGEVFPFKNLETFHVSVGRSFYLCSGCIVSGHLEKRVAHVAKLSKERAKSEREKIVKYCNANTKGVEKADG